MQIKTFWIGGKQNVLSVLDSEICIEALIDEKRRDVEIYKNKKKIKILSKKHINKKFSEFNDYNHQGFAALIKFKNILDTDEFFKLENNKNVLALDEIQDVGNYGTIIRSCVAFGVNTILLNKSKLTKQLALIFKNSAGAFKNINIIYTSNIFNEIKKFKKNNFTVISMSNDCSTSLYKFSWGDKNLIIVGSEDKGIKKNILKNSDFIVKININKDSESLNVAQATSISLYDLSVKKLF